MWYFPQTGAAWWRRWRHLALWPILVLAPPLAAAPATTGGTGFFLGGAGHLVTAAHVVASCRAISVVPEGAAPRPAEAAARDAVRDVAVLRVAGAAFPGPDLVGEVATGAELTALGYPRAAAGGDLRRLPLTAIELPIPRPPDRMPLRGAVAEAGMSGAPLLDAQGRVAGMLLGRGDPAAAASAALAQRMGYPVDQIAIALPAALLADMVPAGRTERRGPVTVARVLCTPG
jgi:S1-C subfamily serine protease